MRTKKLKTKDALKKENHNNVPVGVMMIFAVVCFVVGILWGWFVFGKNFYNNDYGEFNRDTGVMTINTNMCEGDRDCVYRVFRHEFMHYMINEGYVKITPEKVEQCLQINPSLRDYSDEEILSYCNEFHMVQ